MPKVTPIKKHLLVKRARLMKYLRSEHYSDQEIADIFFGINRSTVGRIITAAKKYKEFSKKILAD